MLEIRHEGVHHTNSSREAYDRLFLQTHLERSDSFYLWILGQLELSPGTLLLDVACGEGRFVKVAVERNYQCIGVDISRVALQRAASRIPLPELIVADGESLPLPSGCIDCVTSLGSLEHYQDPGNGVEEIRRVLKSGAKACILVPNAFGLFGNIAHVYEHGDIFDDGQPLQRYATIGAWQRLLERGGLRVMRIVPYSEIDRPLGLRELWGVLRRPGRVVRAVLSRALPLNLANQFVYLCCRD